MSRIRSKNTGIEKAAYRHLRQRKIYFQKHYNKIPGRPDIALPRKRKAVFIDGDFWHGWKFKEKRKRLPDGYWVEKIENNIKRDRRSRSALRRNGWDVLQVWEHDMKKDLEKSLLRIERFLAEQSPAIE